MSHREDAPAPAPTVVERAACALAAVLAVAVAVFYLAVLRSQDGDQAPVWVLALFLLGTAGAVTAAARPGTPPVLAALLFLGVLTLVSLASIGVLLLPSLVLLSYVLVRRTRPE